jgi:hypothetical protein
MWVIESNGEERKKKTCVGGLFIRSIEKRTEKKRE